MTQKGPRFIHQNDIFRIYRIIIFSKKKKTKRIKQTQTRRAYRQPAQLVQLIFFFIEKYIL